MEFKIFNRFATLALLLVCLLAPCRSWAIPTEITISGFLEDPEGRPLDGAFLYQVDFFESEMSIESIDTVTSATFITAGVFSLQIEPAPEIVTLDEVWYSLAIDVDRNGLDLMDLFDERFKITSVPFALSARPVTFFDTHGSTSSGVATFGGDVRNDLKLAPFTTPPGGVKFDQMSVFLQAHSSSLLKVSFGIYDATGKRVSWSGAVFLTAGSTPSIRVVPVSGILRPSTQYYTGWGTNNAGQGAKEIGPSIKKIIVPTTLNVGSVHGVVVDGIIPASFDPNAIVPRLDGAISITLIADP